MIARRVAENLRLYVITDRLALGGRDLVDAVATTLARVPRGGAAVQLREKDLATRELLALCRALVAVTRARACPLLISDRLDVALAAGASGVHLPESGLDIEDARRVLGPDGLVGASTHSPEDAVLAARKSADIVVLGPIWATPKGDGMSHSLGCDALLRARRLAAAQGDLFAGARLLALGGITSIERASQSVQSGAHGVAGIRLFLGQGQDTPDPGEVYEAIADHGSSSDPLRSSDELG